MKATAKQVVASGRTGTVTTGYLDKATLVRAAADIADRDGWSNLTLSQVAKQVGRHVTSLYAHVDGLEALRREIALLGMQELGDLLWQAALGRTGEDALRSIASVEREFARVHPGRITAMTALGSRADGELAARGARLAEPLRATLRSFGLDDDHVHQAHSVFSCALRGLVIAQATESFPFEDADRTFEGLIRLFVAALSAGTWPG